MVNGFDEMMQYKMPSTLKDIDVLFVGTPSKRREKIIQILEKKFNIVYTQAFGEEMTKYFNRAKIVLNLHTFENLDTETRVFEALGCGAFLISEKLSTENPFISGKDYVEVETGDVEAIDKAIEYYLRNSKERNQIAESGYNEALKHHTYTERAKYITEVMEKYTGEIDKSKPAINKNVVMNYIKNKNNPKSYDKVYDIRTNYTTNKLFTIINSMDKEEDVIDNTQQIISLINKNEININDLINIIVNRTVKKEELLDYIAVKFYETKLVDLALKLLMVAYEINEENIDTLYNLGYVLSNCGEYKVAMSYIQKYKGKDKDLDCLIKNIYEKLKCDESLYIKNYKYVFDSEGNYAEELKAQYWLRVNSEYCSQIEKTFKCVETLDNGFGGWALSKSSLRYLCGYLFSKRKSEYNIIELGSGQSTLFWNKFMDISNLNLNINTFEHDGYWANEVRKKVNYNGKININVCKLYTIDDNIWNCMFSYPKNSIGIWSKYSTEIPENQYKNTRVHNCFYNIKKSMFSKEGSIDAMIVDGPHGNGRSLSYVLFYNYLKSDAYILIDDVNHYPFLDELNKIYNFIILESSFSSNKRWILLRLNGYKF
ncbi:glycosyltransferase [Clostridium ljungdahlii]|uniref:glycosyltransferase family protein n=1 Tax=Clostridium ljungdahlii TaxID=1538 RepID=UPI00386C0A6E